MLIFISGRNKKNSLIKTEIIVLPKIKINKSLTITNFVSLKSKNYEILEKLNSIKKMFLIIKIPKNNKENNTLRFF